MDRACGEGNVTGWVQGKWSTYSINFGHLPEAFEVEGLFEGARQCYHDDGRENSLGDRMENNQ